MPTLFTFWEPRGTVPAYLQLCLETWQRHLPEWRVVVIDYGNLAEHAGEGVLDLDRLKRFRLAMQKDAIEAAVLARNGGVFMDADTILTGPLDGIVGRLKSSELVLFNVFLGFAAARPGGAIVASWRDQAAERIRQCGDPARVGWGYLGNEIVAEVIRQLTNESALMRGIAHMPGGRALRDFADAALDPSGGALLRGARRVRQVAFRAARRAVFRASAPGRLHTLNPYRWGFVPEARQFRWSGLPARERYERFWFSESIALDRAATHRQSVIALHHSWTPDWYCRLSREEVLEHPCLLSRLLRTLSATPA